MSLDSLQQHWEKFAREDPMWAILTAPGKENRAWDEAEFFRTGEQQIQMLMDWIRHILPRATRTNALDFGCGMGRLTQALAPLCGSVTGVDISPTMVDLASRHPRKPANCQFVCNQKADLAQFASCSFDFVHTSITLQHIRPEFARGYIREFARILRPGGMLCFQLPTEAKFDQTAAHRSFRLMMQRATVRFRAWRGRAAMEMHGMPEPEVRALCLSAGLAIVALRPSTAAGPGWDSFEYLAVKLQPR